MTEWFADFSSLSIFLTLGAIGFLFLIASFFFGEMFDQGDSHLGAGHGLGNHGPGLFDLRNAGLFLTTLGAFGALARLRGYGTAVSSLVGLFGGATLAGVIFFYTRFLFRQQASSLISSDDLVGRRAEVIIAIPEGGAGQIRCLIGESMIEKIARTRDGQSLAHGASVLIEEIVSETVIVSEWHTLTEGRSLFDPTTSTDADDSAVQKKEKPE